MEIDDQLLVFMPSYKKLWVSEDPQYRDALTDEMFRSVYVKSLRASGFAKLIRKPNGEYRLEPTPAYTPSNVGPHRVNNADNSASLRPARDEQFCLEPPSAT